MKDTAQTALTLAKRTQARAIFLVLLAGSLWGCIGLFSRTLSALGVGPESIVILRNAGACVVLAVLFLVYDRSIFRIQLRHFPIFLGTGIVSILFFTLCYFNSQQVSSLAVSAILLYTAPTFVVLLSALFWREKITKQKLLLLGIGSGLFYSSYTLFGRVALSHYPPFTVTFYTFLVAGIGSLFLIRPQELAIVTGSGRGLLLALGLILISTVLPYLFYTKGLNDLGDGGKASILASVEPVVASLVGILVFGEPMGIGTLVGLVCILVSIYILR